MFAAEAVERTQRKLLNTNSFIFNLPPGSICRGFMAGFSPIRSNKKQQAVLTMRIVFG
jgi:hypothetical protein